MRIDKIVISLIGPENFQRYSQFPGIFDDYYRYCQDQFRGEWGTLVMAAKQLRALHQVDGKFTSLGGEQPAKLDPQLLKELNVDLFAHYELTTANDLRELAAMRLERLTIWDFWLAIYLDGERLTGQKRQLTGLSSSYWPSSLNSRVQDAELLRALDELQWRMTGGSWEEEPQQWVTYASVFMIEAMFGYDLNEHSHEMFGWFMREEERRFSTNFSRYANKLPSLYD